MNIAQIIESDVANGPGIRLSVFVSGCTLNCPNCFNEKAHDFNYGKPLTKEICSNILLSLTHPKYSGVTILGGEPFEPANVNEVYSLASQIKTRFPALDLWIYTGHTLENLRARKDAATNALLDLCDVLVDGPFIESQKNISLRYCGSKNQRLIDMSATRASGYKTITLWHTPERYAY